MWDVGGYLITGAAVVVAAHNLLRGDIRARGVMTAETAFDPQPFLDRMVDVLREHLPDRNVNDKSFEWID
jgi:hypothetical protein